MKKFTIEEIVHGFKSDNSRIINAVYQDIFPKVESYVHSNNGNYQDAKDVYHDGLTFILEKVNDNKLFIKENFHTFLFGVCRNMWLRILNDRKQIRYDLKEYAQFLYQEYNDEDEVEKKELLFKIVQRNFKQMKPKCQETLKLFLENISYREIVAILGLGSELYAKSLKYRCRKQLIQDVLNDPEFESLYP